MTVYILSAGVAAFLICHVFGKRLVPWLEKYEILQPLKDGVKEKVYQGADGDTDTNS